MLAEIIAIGRELLTGKTLDTNSHWLAQQLTGMGIRVKRIVLVDDVVDEIAQEVLTSVKYGVKLIITTGGLGPTFDDKTLEAISKATGRRLQLNLQALKMVEESYRRFHQLGYVDSPEITPERKKMAIIPDGAIPIPNPVGAAPGVMLKIGPHIIVSLPGVPKEMKAIFENHVKPRIEELIKQEGKGRKVREKTVSSGLSDESVIASAVKKVMEKVPGVYIKSLPDTFGKEVDIPVRFTAEAETEEEAERLLNKAVNLFFSTLKGDLTNGREGINKDN